jgi:uncharacterized membrane protein
MFYPYRLQAFPPASGADRSDAMAVNEYDTVAKRLQVAGDAVCGTAEYCARLWTIVGVNSLYEDDLNALGNLLSSQALGLNSVFPSQVVGWGAVQGQAHFPIMWEKTGTTHLKTVGGSDGEARDVNNAGDAVGWSNDAVGLHRATRWPAGAGLPST